MTNPWRDPRVPSSEECVLRPLLERRAADTPDKVFARFADGSTWTYGQASTECWSFMRAVPPALP